MHSFQIYLVIVALFFLTMLSGKRCAAESIAQELMAGFDYSVRLLSYSLIQEPADTLQNPGNTVFQISQNRVVGELRPDFSLMYKNIDLSAKPRIRYQWQRLEVAGFTEIEETGDLFVNEWLARILVGDRLFLSYGRENLQWGPGWLSSPSNPFFYANGRLNPKLEVPGKDFARIVYLPDMAWTVSLISNLDNGGTATHHKEGFEKIHALKVDYTAEAAYGGAILSHRESKGASAGAFGGWTASNAMLLYGDVNFSTNNSRAYLQKTALLAGVSYTLESGPTLALEYVYQKNDPDFLNHNTVMLQYYQNEIINRIDLLCRVTANIDDGSKQFVVNADYMAGDHIQLFLNTIINSSSKNGEFGNFLDYQVMAGLEYSF